MRKLFLSLIITLGALSAPNAWADLDTGGTTLDATKAGKAKLQQIMTSICSATGTGTDATIKTSVSKTDAGYVEPGTVFFVDMNSHWIGTYENYSVYKEINEGVKDVIQVKDKSKQTTKTGTFYTHEASNANKFFFIVRRSERRTGNSVYNNTAFSWYNEWSYVKNTSDGYAELQSSLNELNDGAPFFSPHDCGTSLENNHYITLNEKDDYTSSGYYFTAYLYIPKYVNTSSSATTVTEDNGVINETPSTYYITTSSGSFFESYTAVTDAPDNLWIKENGEYVRLNQSSYATSSDKKYYTTSRLYYNYETVDVYKSGTTTITVPANNVPYVFFYRIKLGDIGSADEAAVTDNIVSTLTPPETTSSETNMKCDYKVNLDWGTSFDRFRSKLAATSYDTMKEHFIIQRSFDKTDWVEIGTLDVSSNDGDKERMKYESYKTFTDANLPDFNETTKKIGYTVYYRIVSEVQKADGTVMSTTTSNDITVDIPGNTPFKLTLEAGNTSTYTPGSMNGENYTEGSNTFANTLTAAKSVYEGTVNLAEGVKLELVRTTYDKDGKATTEAIKSSTCTATTTLDNLIAAIDKVKDEVTTEAGEKYDAQYQLVLTYNDGTTTESNIVKIVNSKVSNTSVSVHRSGTPDVTTCAKTELFRNTVKFKPQMSAVTGAGYYVYCNGELVLTLNDNTNNTDFTGSNGTKYTVDDDGFITMTFFAEHAPIAVGETGETSETTTSFHYAVAHFDASDNTYGSAAEASVYSGAKDELVVMFNNPSATLIKSYYYVIMRPVVTWKLNKSEWDDVASPIRYEVYLKQEQAEFEKTDNDAYKGLDSSVDTNEFPFGEYKLRTTIEKDSQGNLSTSFADDIYYARKNQYAGSWVNPIAAEEIRPISYYVRAIYKEEYNETERNKAEKNSDVYEVTVTPGGIFTDIEGVSAEGVSVEANDGVITVAGASGTIVVYSATGQAVATAQGDGGVTTIDASNLNGVYIVKANNMKPTKILIK